MEAFLIGIAVLHGSKPVYTLPWLRSGVQHWVLFGSLLLLFAIKEFLTEELRRIGETMSILAGLSEEDESETIEVGESRKMKTIVSSVLAGTLSLFLIATLVPIVFLNCETAEKSWMVTLLALHFILLAEIKFGLLTRIDRVKSVWFNRVKPETKIKTGQFTLLDP